MHTHTVMDASMHTCVHIQDDHKCPDLFEKHIIHTPAHISLEPWASAAARESGHFNQANNPLPYFNLPAPFLTQSVLLPHKTYTYRPHQTPPPLWQPYHYICNPSTPWKQPLMFFLVSPCPKTPHKHTCTIQSFSIKITRLSKCHCPPVCTVSLHCFRWKALTEACDYDFWQGVINWMFKNCITWSPMCPGWNAHLNGIFDQDGWSSLVRWAAEGWMGCRWRGRRGGGC